MEVAGIGVAVGMSNGVGVAGMRVSVGSGVLLSGFAVGTTIASTDLTAATPQAETRQIPNRVTKTIINIFTFFMNYALEETGSPLQGRNMFSSLNSAKEFADLT